MSHTNRYIVLELNVGKRIAPPSDGVWFQVDVKVGHCDPEPSPLDLLALVYRTPQMENPQQALYDAWTHGIVERLNKSPDRWPKT